MQMTPFQGESTKSLINSLILNSIIWFINKILELFFYNLNNILI